MRLTRDKLIASINQIPDQVLSEIDVPAYGIRISHRPGLDSESTAGKPERWILVSDHITQYGSEPYARKETAP